MVSCKTKFVLKTPTFDANFYLFFVFVYFLPASLVANFDQLSERFITPGMIEPFFRLSHLVIYLVTYIKTIIIILLSLITKHNIGKHENIIYYMHIRVYIIFAYNGCNTLRVKAW